MQDALPKNSLFIQKQIDAQFAICQETHTPGMIQQQRPFTTTSKYDCHTDNCNLQQQPHSDHAADGWKVPMFVHEPYDPTKIPMYPKHLVYCGEREMSLEELKFIKNKEKENKFNKMAREIEALKAHAIQQEAKILRLQQLKKGLPTNVTQISSASPRSLEKTKIPSVMAANPQQHPPLLQHRNHIVKESQNSDEVSRIAQTSNTGLFGVMDDSQRGYRSPSSDGCSIETHNEIQRNRFISSMGCPQETEVYKKNLPEFVIANTDYSLLPVSNMAHIEISKPVSEEETIMLPSNPEDFFKGINTHVSTPHPRSYGVVPQRNEDEECTMKFPLKQRQEDLYKADEPTIPEVALPLSVGETTKHYDVFTKNLSSQLLPSSVMMDSIHSGHLDSPSTNSLIVLKTPIEDLSNGIDDCSKQDPNESMFDSCPLKEVAAECPEDPFDENLRSSFLQQLKLPVEERFGYIPFTSKLPKIKGNTTVKLESTHYYVTELKGSGAYAQVYHASTQASMNVTIAPSETSIQESQMILKVQKPKSVWEFYVCHELRERLKQSDAKEFLDSLMRINRAYFFSNGSILVSEYHQYGTVLDLVNRYKNKNKTLPAVIILYLILELICIVEKMHNCGFIHADLKPDNLLIKRLAGPGLFSSRNPVDDGPCLLKLIDFGRSIDMWMLPKGASFTKKVTTKGFTCCEMKDGLPWAYQTDYFGIASITHCLLWGSYMQVKKGSQWELKGVIFQRSWPIVLKLLFESLLNAPSRGDRLDLSKLKQELYQEYLRRDIDNRDVAVFDSLLQNK